MPQENERIIEDLKSVIVSLRDDLNKVKVQTGELIAARQQIAEIDRALRGHDGQRGLMERFGLIEQSLELLVKTQIPALLETIRTGSKNDIEICRANQQLEHERIKSDLERLRNEYQMFVTQSALERGREEKEHSKFGGRDWWRENTSGIIIAVITALVILFGSGMVQKILSTIP